MPFRYDAQVIPWLVDFDPDLLIVSAGFDCLADDPLAQVRWID